jgi:hypothetical protein
MKIKMKRGYGQNDKTLVLSDWLRTAVHSVHDLQSGPDVLGSLV